MTIFLIKSLFALLLLVPAVYGMYTMLEVFGRNAPAERAAQLKKRHRVSGWTFVILFSLISYLCIVFLAASRAEPSSRTALHILLALVIIALFIVKVLFVRIYRQFYGVARTIGIALGVLVMALVGMSAGVYLAMTRFGQDRTVDKSVYYVLRGPFLSVHPIAAPGAATIRTDRQSIARGRTLFLARCSACHDPESTQTKVGPGLKGLLRNPRLPKSGHPATAESIRFQLRQPLGVMPSFAYLSDDEMNDLIAYLNTL
jgi:mono/diheme cytochrome c family protein